MQPSFSLATRISPPPDPAWGLSLKAIVICAGIALVICALRRYRFSLIRQVFAALAAAGVVVWVYRVLLALGWQRSTEDLVFVMIAISLGFGLALSAIHGPALAVAWIGLLSSNAALLFISYIFLDQLNIYLSDLFYTHDIISPKLRSGIRFAIFVIWIPCCLVHAHRQHRHSTATYRLLNGSCPACAYSLRGSAGQATCPECGEAIPWDRVVLPT